ncbi:MAG TPA: hypothetical protein VJS88_03910 [Chthoniobacterales bacterium]|nr:hypothetical protein [Chthoniobacterales bacterium]
MKKLRNRLRPLTAISAVLLLAVGLPGCSRFSKTGRMDRAYYKQLKQVRAQREKRREQLIEHQRAEMPSLRNSPPPLQQTTTESPPESQ